MRKSERSSYTALDFLQWKQAGTLVISPKFQRRGVWSPAAQSYLIDTLLLGLPVPPIYLRVVQDQSKKAMIREVIDGQQRIRTLLSFLGDEFALSKNIESPAIGKTFSELTSEQKDAVTQSNFICEVFYGVDDADVLKIFSRMNTYSIKLNAQELRNGNFFGQFKTAAYDLALEHLEFWRQKRIFSEQAIARMQEAELTSELMIAAIAGIQDKKKSIDSFYIRFDKEFKDRKEIEARFRQTIDVLNDYVGDIISYTEFRRPPLFYSLYLALYHRLFAIPNSPFSAVPQGKMGRGEKDGLRTAVGLLSAALQDAKEEPGRQPPEYSEFLAACARQTDNLKPRNIRFETIYRRAFT